MDWQKAKDLPIGHVWHHADLAKHFPAIMGGVAFPGRRPGFAIVAGLRDPMGLREVHVLDEYDSADLSELLRACSALAEKYRVRERGEFRWVGDNRKVAVRTLLAEMDHGPQIASTRILEMEAPYQYMMSKLKEYLTGDKKTLFLRGSRVAEMMGEIRPDEVPYLEFGDFPAIEALAFVVKALHEEAENIAWDLHHLDYSEPEPVHWQDWG